jgi:hypothetical protein
VANTAPDDPLDKMPSYEQNNRFAMTARTAKADANRLSSVKPSHIGNLLAWAIIAFADIFLVIAILHSPGHMIFDETTNFEYVSVLQEYGLSVDFLRAIPGGAGPTFAFVYYPFRVGLGVDFPYIRLVSTVLLAASVLVLWRILADTQADRHSDSTQASPALLAGIFTCLPSVAVSAGMALTEMPAVFFTFVALSLLIRLQRHIVASVFSVATASGLAMGFAVLARQNILVAIPCLVLLFDWPNAGAPRHAMTAICLVALCALIVVLPVFIVWGGLIPPLQAQIGAGVALSHGVLALAYAGVLTALLAPAFFRPLLNKTLAVAALVLALAFFAAFNEFHVPMHTVVVSVGGETTYALLGYVFPLVLSVVAALFLVGAAHHGWGARKLPVARFLYCVTVIGLLSNAKNTAQFSSRYIFVFLPFLFLCLAGFVRNNWHLPIRLGIGAVISLASLVSYFIS